jgi:TetR/AcrR family transcriptional repressor of uid operon
MAKQARAFATREAILLAAGEVFSTVSYSAATLGDVVRQAGVTQGSLYFHFDSKLDLAVEVISRQHETAMRGIENVPRDLSGIEQMIFLSGTIAEQITTNPIVRGGMRLSTESPEMFPGVASKPYMDWIQACELLLLKAVSHGQIAQSWDCTVLARVIMSAYTGVQVVSQSTTQWADLGQRLQDM